jgi:hypothetical protein
VYDERKDKTVPLIVCQHSVVSEKHNNMVHVTVTLRPRFIVALQTTREIWEQEGPFPTYNIDNRGPRNVPYEFTKAATWTIIDGVEGYYARLLIEPEVEVGRYYPVEFNFK